MAAMMAAAIALVAALTAQPSLGEDGRCIDDWSVAAPLVRSEGLVTVEKLAGEVHARLNGTIVKASLCERDGAYVFRIVLRTAGGLRSLTLDARTPFGP